MTNARRTLEVGDGQFQWSVHGEVRVEASG